MPMCEVRVHQGSVLSTLLFIIMLEAGLEAIKFEFILKLKIKRNDWLLVDTCPQAANRYALF